MLVSIIIVNYNYGDYIAQAIDSALEQTFEQVEVIVIDDGSTDNSRSIIESYGSRIKPIYQQNGGQVAAANHSIQQARGDVILFLDSDDVLMPDAAERHVAALADPSVVKSQGTLLAVDEFGRQTGGQIPSHLSESGDYFSEYLRYGPGVYRSAFTSGNAWKAEFMREVFPLPDEKHAFLGTDSYLSAIDPLFGNIASLPEPIGYYRIHGENRGPAGYTFDRAFLEKRLGAYFQRLDFAQQWVSKMGISPRRHGWVSAANWPLNLALVALRRFRGEKTSLRESLRIVLSPLRRRKIPFLRALFLTGILAAAMILPRKQSLELSRRLLDRSWGYTASQGSARRSLRPVVA